MTRVREESVKNFYVRIETHVHMLSLEDKQHPLYMKNNNPYAQRWHMLHKDENTDNSLDRGQDIEIISLLTSDQQ